MILMTTRNQFTAVFKKTKDWVIAWIEEIPGVNTQGKTLTEARENLRDHSSKGAESLPAGNLSK